MSESSPIEAARAKIIDALLLLGRLGGAAETSNGLAAMRSESISELVLTLRTALDALSERQRADDEAALRMLQELAEQRRRHDAEMAALRASAEASARANPSWPPRTGGA